jgi:hypothetical protein
VPTVRQCGHGVSLSRSTIAAHSASPPQNHRSSLTIGPLPPNATERTESAASGREAGSDEFDSMEEAGSANWERPQNRTGRFTKFPLSNNPPNRTAVR